MNLKQAVKRIAKRTGFAHSMNHVDTPRDGYLVRRKNLEEIRPHTIDEDVISGWMSRYISKRLVTLAFDKNYLLGDVEWGSMRLDVADHYEGLEEALRIAVKRGQEVVHDLDKDNDISVVTWARKCSVTGKGMNSGYCIGDGQMYVKGHFAMLQHITDETEYADMDEAWDDDYYYHTEWEEVDDHQYVEINGNLIDIE